MSRRLLFIVWMRVHGHIAGCTQGAGGEVGGAVIGTITAISALPMTTKICPAACSCSWVVAASPPLKAIGASGCIAVCFASLVAFQPCFFVLGGLPLSVVAVGASRGSRWSRCRLEAPSTVRLVKLWRLAHECCSSWCLVIPSQLAMQRFFEFMWQD